MAIAIQLIGKKQVIEAYSNLDVDVWAIFQYKSLMTKGQGISMLEQFLELLSTNAAGAIYTLKVYEDIDDPKQVKEKTEASASLNFKLNTQDFAEDGSPVYLNKLENYKLYQEIQGLKKQIEEMGTYREPETLEQAAIGLLGNPGELATLVMAVKELFRPAGTPAPQLPQPATVGKINTGMKIDQLTDNDRQRLANALDILGNKDPKIIEHLEKLAAVANNNPSQFQLLLMTLDNMK